MGMRSSSPASFESKLLVASSRQQRPGSMAKACRANGKQRLSEPSCSPWPSPDGRTHRSMSTIEKCVMRPTAATHAAAGRGYSERQAHWTLCCAARPSEPSVNGMA